MCAILPLPGKCKKLPVIIDGGLQGVMSLKAVRLLINSLVAICCALVLEAFVISITCGEAILAPTMRFVFQQKELRPDEQPLILLFHSMVANSLYFIVPAIIIAMTVSQRKETESSVSELSK